VRQMILVSLKKGGGAHGREVLSVQGLNYEKNFVKAGVGCGPPCRPAGGGGRKGHTGQGGR